MLTTSHDWGVLAAGTRGATPPPIDPSTSIAPRCSISASNLPFGPSARPNRQHLGPCRFLAAVLGFDDRLPDVAVALWLLLGLIARDRTIQRSAHDGALHVLGNGRIPGAAAGDQSQDGIVALAG